jgi:hypothetical protein
VAPAAKEVIWANRIWLHVTRLKKDGLETRLALQAHGLFKATKISLRLKPSEKNHFSRFTSPGFGTIREISQP